MYTKVNMSLLVIVVVGLITSLGCASGFDYSAKDGAFDRMAIVDKLLANYPLLSKSDNADVSPYKNASIKTAKFEDDPANGGVFIPGHYTTWRTEPASVDLLLNNVAGFDPENFVISVDVLIDHIATGDEVQKNINPKNLPFLVWGDDARELGFGYWDGKIFLLNKNNTYKVTNVGFPLKTWNTLAVTYRAEKNNLIELFLNGKLIVTQNAKLQKLPFFFSTTNYSNASTFRGNIKNIIVGTPKSIEE